MSRGAQFSGNVLVNDQQTIRFEPFELNKANAQKLTTLSDSSQLAYGFSYVGEGTRAAHAKLRGLEALNLVNARPERNLAGTRAAVCQGQGELVTVDFCLYNQDEDDTVERVIRTGIVAQLVYSGGPGGPKKQRLDFVLYLCDKLHVVAGGAVTTLEALA